MSTDARYIFVYDNPGYVSPTPMDKDAKFLEEEFGGKVENLYGGQIYFWDKPKHCLCDEDIENISADQIFEMRDGYLLEQIK